MFVGLKTEKIGTRRSGAPTTTRAEPLGGGRGRVKSLKDQRIVGLEGWKIGETVHLLAMKLEASADS